MRLLQDNKIFVRSAFFDCAALRLRSECFHDCLFRAIRVSSWIKLLLLHFRRHRNLPSLFEVQRQLYLIASLQRPS
jgi:hypothetical protein